uniref:Uncharacterized protein n=1 Tax=Oryza brachyantha TaxID=4533 RepID=J3KU67_ORYBR
MGKGEAQQLRPRARSGRISRTTTGEVMENRWRQSEVRHEERGYVARVRRGKRVCATEKGLRA